MNSTREKAAGFKIVLKVMFPVALIALGGAAWAYFHSTSPQVKRTLHKPQATLVNVVTVKTANSRAIIKAMGTVRASREITLKSRVSGEVLDLSPQFVPGGHVARGDLILKIDPSDYQIEVRKAESALARAMADLAIEQGNQVIAREELRLLSETSIEAIANTDLALRKPQLEHARAAVASAEADLHRAGLDLSRTVVRAPFNALVIDRGINLGSHISTQDALATIVGTDEYWIEAAVPLDRLSALDINRKNGCPAVVRSQTGCGTWKGHVLRSTGKLSEKSRMAKVIIAIQDPLGIDSGGTSPQLMLDDYVSVEIKGREFASVIDLPRLALRDQDTVWVFHNEALEIRKVTLAWKQGERVLVRSGLVSGETVVISDLATPVQGMGLKSMAGNLESDPAGSADTGG